MTKDPRSSKDDTELTSMMFAPLSSRGKIIGVMAIGSENKVTYTSQDLSQLCTFAFQTAVAVENAKLYMGLREAFYETVNTLSEAIERRDTNTAGHAKRVVDYSLLIGREMGMPQVQSEERQN
jgi:GAF domain-containing protein